MNSMFILLIAQGIFPKNHVYTKHSKKMKRNNAVVTEVDEDPIAREISGRPAA